MRDYRRGIGFPSLRLGQVRSGLGEVGLARQQETLQRLDIGGQRRTRKGHARIRADSRSSEEMASAAESPCRTRSPSPLRMSPVDRLQQVAEL